jgi:hypothetical protein
VTGRWRVLAAATLVTAATAACDRYEANDLELLTAYTAKQTCSCVFVMKRSDAFCTAWTKEAPDVKTATIDRENKRVETQALNLWGARARYVDARHGCVLE